MTPIASQWLGIYFPAQFIICVTLFATTNSRSLNSEIKKEYLSCKLVSDEKPVLDFNCPNHVLFIQELLLLVQWHPVRRPVKVN